MCMGATQSIYFRTAKYYPVGATFVALSVELFFPVAFSPLAGFFPFPFRFPFGPFLLFLPDDLGRRFPRSATAAGELSRLIRSRRNFPGCHF